MEGAGGGASWFDVTKTKLLVLSSMVGIGAIIYLTKNYIERGQFIPQTSSQTSLSKKTNKKRPKVVGGKYSVSIKDDFDTKSISSRSVRHRSRQSSTCSSRRKTSIFNSSKQKRCVSFAEEIDINLNNAINELSSTVTEVEEILGLKSAENAAEDITNLSSNNVGNHMIVDEIKKIKKLIDFAQDIDNVVDRTTEYVMNHQQLIEDVVPITETEIYPENVEMLFNLNDDDYDSDNDSFISAVDSIDFDLSDEEEYENAIQFNAKLKELINKHNTEDFYMQGIEYLTHYGVPVRSIRSDLLHCDNDIDYCVKVHCLRLAFVDLLKNDENRKWFVESGKEMLIALLQKANYDSAQFSSDYDKMIDYCSSSENWSDIDIELTGRGVCNLNFFDIVLDLLIMDSFEDLENPPSAVTSAIQNRWLSLRIKETALSTAIWTVIKAKKHRLVNQNGFYAMFYDISMYLTPVLAWGFLGPVKELNNLCEKFKDVMVSFLRDIFSTDSTSYKTVQTLAEDILISAKKRKHELLSAISR